MNGILPIILPSKNEHSTRDGTSLRVETIKDIFFSRIKDFHSKKVIRH